MRKNRKEKIKNLNLLIQDLYYLQKYLCELVEIIQTNMEYDESIMKLHTIHFNYAVYEINIFYKQILDLCVELYWEKPSYISIPRYKNIFNSIS